MYAQPDLVNTIKSSRVQWLGNVARMNGQSVPKQMIDGEPGDERSSGRPRLRWLEDVQNDLRRMGVRSWMRHAQDRED